MGLFIQHLAVAPLAARPPTPRGELAPFDLPPPPRHSPAPWSANYPPATPLRRLACEPGQVNGDGLSPVPALNALVSKAAPPPPPPQVSAAATQPGGKAKAKAKVVSQGNAPVVIRESARMAIKDVGRGPESGWRALINKNAEKLGTQFLKEGTYLTNLMKKPDIRWSNGQYVLCRDGTFALGDGLRTFGALDYCLVIWEQPELAEQEEWSEKLAYDLEHGVDCRVVEFPNDDPKAILAYYAYAHDENNNDYIKTTVRNLVDCSGCS